MHRLALLFAVVLAGACSGSSRNATPAASTAHVAIVGFGVRVVPAPSMSAAIMTAPKPNLVIGPVEGPPVSALAMKAMLVPGEAPTQPLVRREGKLVRFADGNDGTTELVLTRGLDDYAGVIREITTSPRDTAWTVVVDGKDVQWPDHARLDIAPDGSFKLERPQR